MKYQSYFENARVASRKPVDPNVINLVLLQLAEAAIDEMDYLLAENKKDLARMDPADPKYDRLKFTPERIRGIAADIDQVVHLNSPIGEILSERIMPNGLHISKVRVPLGVVGIVYEARPNV